MGAWPGTPPAWPETCDFTPHDSPGQSDLPLPLSLESGTGERGTEEVSCEGRTEGTWGRPALRAALGDGEQVEGGGSSKDGKAREGSQSAESRKRLSSSFPRLCGLLEPYSNS